MSFSEGFDIGYLKVSADRQEDIFLSVTPQMRLGPGIQRDGVTAPRMTDPHTVPFVMGRGIPPLDARDFPATTNAYVQRAGTWTLFEHVYRFVEKHGKDYRIIGVQSNGDLTMNPWHVALTWEDGRPVLYHLATAGDPPSIHEPVHERTYRCLVKWKPGSKDYLYEFLDLKFDAVNRGYEARLVQPDSGDGSTREQTETQIHITDDIEFALSGKVIVHKGHDISLSSAIDQFQDVRHIFNVPEIDVRDMQGSLRGKINFGEHVLFHDLNARRAALTSPIIVDLRIPNRDLVVHIEDLKNTLVNRHHYRVSQDSPTSRGEFRKYSDTSVELFYRHNVYPFGVLGGARGALVCLSSGGLSGRVGNTLEGIIRIMYDFFACEDALVLDEGYDTFHLLNPNPKKEQKDSDNYKYNNQDILKQVAAFTLWRMESDQAECKEAENKKEEKDRYKLGADMWKWPLNTAGYQLVTEYCTEHKISPAPPSNLDVLAVEPRRSQMRSVLIFAVRRSPAGESPNAV
jgi:hypothetical protein